MPRAKKQRGFALPPVNETPEELAKRLFTPSLPNTSRKGQARARVPRQGEVLSIKVQEGSPAHRWFEEQETASRRRAEERSE